MSTSNAPSDPTRPSESEDEHDAETTSDAVAPQSDDGRDTPDDAPVVEESPVAAADDAPAGDDPVADDDPVDADFTPASTTDTHETQPAERAGVSFPMAAVLAAAAAVAGGYMGVVFDSPNTGPSPERVAALEERVALLANAATTGSSVDADALAALDARLSELSGEIDAAGQQTTAPAPTTISDSGAAQAALAIAQALDGRLTTLQSEVTALREQVAALDNTTVRMATHVAGEVPPLETPAFEAPSGAERADAMLIVAALRDAASAEGDFTAELAEAEILMPEDPGIAALAPFAEAGAPSRAELEGAFRQAGREVIALERGGPGGLLHRMSQGVTDMVAVRRADAPDTSRAAVDVVMRAQKLMADGDLRGAADVMARLRPPALDHVAGWVAHAQTRASLDAALALIGVADPDEAMLAAAAAPAAPPEESEDVAASPDAGAEDALSETPDDASDQGAGDVADAADADAETEAPRPEPETVGTEVTGDDALEDGASDGDQNEGEPTAADTADDAVTPDVETAEPDADTEAESGDAPADDDSAEDAAAEDDAGDAAEPSDDG